jgi:hypothetical protein
MSRYHAYLLRIWRDEEGHNAGRGDPGPWRFSLEDPASGDRRGFRSLAEVTAFLNLTMTPLEPDEESAADFTDEAG